MENYKKNTKTKPQTTTWINQKEPLGFIFLLKESWKTYKKNFVVLTLVYFIPAVFISFSSNVASFFTAISPLNILSIFIFVPLYFFIVFLGYISIIVILRDREKGQISFSETYQKALPYFFSYLWLLIISSLIILPLSLLIIPGIIFSIFFLLAPFILISEKIKGLSALWKSKELIKNYWWNIFWYNFIISLCLATIYLVSFLIFSLPLTALTTSLGLPFSIGAFDQIQSFVLTLFFTPFLCTFFYLLYEKIKTIKKERVFLLPSKKIKTIFTILEIVGFLIIILLFSFIVLRLS